jgi:hypothetical protein
MAKSDREIVNWITYYLARGFYETQLRARYTEMFGAISDQQWAQDFRGAAYGEANAANFQRANPRQKLKNLLQGIPRGQKTVEIRAVLTFGFYWYDENGVLNFTVTNYGTYSYSADLDETVADVYARFAQMGGRPKPSNVGELGVIEVIPGIYLPY